MLGFKRISIKILPTNLTFHTRCGSIKLSGPKTLIFAAICPNTDFVPSGPASPPRLRDRFTYNDKYVLKLTNIDLLRRKRGVLKHASLKCLYSMDIFRFPSHTSDFNIEMTPEL